MKTNEILNDGRTVETTLKDIICRTMPSAAKASGWVSEIDVTGLVNAAIAAHPWRTVKDWTAAHGAPEFCTLGLSWVRRYCEAHDLPTSDMFVKPFRVELLKAGMREESAR